MSYVDAIHDKDSDLVTVVERNKRGEREYRSYPANYTFYYPDRKGKYRNIYGEPVTKVSCHSRSEFEKERRIHSNKKLFESDINQIFKCLSENYRHVDPPKLHVAILDIETSFDYSRGFAPTDDPFNKVTAITVYLKWLGELVTLAIPPSSMSMESAKELVSDFPNTFLFTNEVEMFEAFFNLIEDADVLTGWNSGGYDIPYLVNRCTRIMSKNDTRKFCLWDELPKPRKYEKFGKEEMTYDLVGRVHMDYLELYRKYNYETRQSYKLDSIGELEVGEKKTEYEGTLDQLYNKDFKKFIEYNRQDVMLLSKIDDKLDFLDLANSLAHENTVLLPTAMGSVAMIEQAIYNESHDYNLVVPDKQRRNDNEESIPAAGAYVASPKVGIHKSIGAIDLASLYPSTIRALNMAPETIVGQLRPTLTDAYMAARKAKLAAEFKKKKSDEEITGPILWEGLFACLEYTAVINQERGTMLTVDYEDGRSVEMSAAEVWKMIFDSHKPYILSANGTIFTLEKVGIIPGLLTKWYSERKVMQKKKKLVSSLSKGIELPPELLTKLSEV